MFERPSPWPARVLALISLSSVGALAIALVAQHAFGVRPCPWCVMQRGVFMLLAAVSGLGWLLRGVKPLRVFALLLCLLLALAGVAAAYYQWDVASQLASCDLTLADRILRALDLEERLPSVFMVTAGCADAAKYKLLGLHYEVWSGALYLLQAVLALRQLLPRKRR